MYKEHNKHIGLFARQSPDNLERVLQFVCATIQQPLEMVPNILDSFSAEKEESKHAWGWKADALAFYDEKKQEIYDISMAIYEGYADPATQELELVKYFANLEGLGLVKGAFVAQLAFGVGACLDVHNMRRYEVEPSRFAASAFKRLSPKSQAKRAFEYCALCAEIGGSEYLWDSWCDFVAELRPEKFANGFEVSKLHLDAIVN